MRGGGEARVFYLTPLREFIAAAPSVLGRCAFSSSPFLLSTLEGAGGLLKGVCVFRVCF